MKPRILTALPLFVIMTGLSGTALAVNQTWKGTVSSNWNLATNWSPGAIPGTGDIAYFDDTATTFAPSLAGSSYTLTLSISGSTSFAINPGTSPLYLRGATAVTSTSSADQSFNGNSYRGNIAGNSTFLNNGTGLLKFLVPIYKEDLSGTSTSTGSLVFDGSGNVEVATLGKRNGNLQAGVIKNGAGTLTIKGFQTVFAASGTTVSGITNITTINAGTVKVTSGDQRSLGQPQSATTGWLTLNGGTLQAATLDLTINNGNAGITLGSNGGTFNVDAARTLTLGGGSATNIISGPGSLTKAGDGTLILAGANAYAGNTTVTAGSLTLQDETSLDDDSSVEITTGTTLNLDFIGTDTIGKLTFDNALQESGTWGAPDSGADYTDTRITGTGMLLVVPKDFTWTHLGGDQKWSTANNWDVKAVPSTGAALNFPDTIQTAITNDLAAGTSIDKITFTDDAPSYTIGGSNSLTVTGSISNLSLNTQTLGFPIELGAAISLNAKDSDIALAGDISGPFGFTKTGFGVLELSGANTYDGVTAINGGILAPLNASALPSGTAVAFTNTTSPAELDITGLHQTLANLTFGTQTTGGNTVSIYGNTSSSLTVSPASLVFAPAATPIASNLSVDMGLLGGFTYDNSAGTFTLQAGASNGSGTTTVTLPETTNSITADQLKLSGLNAAAGNKSILNLGLNNTIHANTINLAANSGRGSATLQYAAGLPSGGTLEIRDATGGGTANLVIGKNSSFNGDTTAYTSILDTTGNAATLDAQIGAMLIGNAHSDGATGRQVKSNGSFIMGAGTLTATSAVIGQLEGVATTGSSNYTASGLLSLSAGGTANIGVITLTNDGMATIGGTNNISGQITIDGSGGTTTLNATTIQQGIVLPGETSRVARINWNDGTIGNIAGGDLAIIGVGIVLATSGNHTFGISTGQTATVSSAISGGGGSTALTKSGGGTLILSGPNTYAGSTAVSAGTLEMTSAFLDDASSVEISTIGAGKLNLNFSGTDAVASLTFDGVPQTTGTTYGASGSGAAVIDNDHFSGTGKLQVGVISDPYSAWIGGFGLALADQDKTDDPDGDGMNNLLEFALDGNPASGASSGKVVSKIDADHLTLTLPVRTGAVFSGSGPLTSAAIDHLIYDIDGSTDLSGFASGVEEIAPLSAGLPNLSDGWTYRTFRLTSAVSSAPKGFLRAGAGEAP